MSKLSAVLVDDEPNNIELLSHFLKKYCPRVEVIGQADTKEDAIAIIPQLEPDLLFMDIVLDEGTGFDVLESIDTTNMQIIFVTAFDEFAIKAFKYNAVDFVLKPVEIEALILAVNHAAERVENNQFIEEKRLSALVEAMTTEKLNQDFIAIPTVNKIEFIKTNTITYCRSDGKYTEFHLKDKRKVVSSKNLGEYEQLLDDKVFFRIHNSYIVNLNYVQNINKSAGNYVELGDHISLPIAKRRQESLARFLRLK
ncbi:DNA-binding response regulator [Dokdonia sinensis]|uniref:DNA-binding response regulator n=1 Tax=Dokdonia sinensis TaxID=2479847 RepID=A0A3M0GE79_9FLAO|nr:LytTR family DNA-binding domain-containing protein [Dokdonia sinensis]RMB60942.1 DNA-binding response regulator [Dokdonia sinensis]